MSYAAYNKSLTTLNPVAIKTGQTEIHAPEHNGWGILTCDDCGDRFCIGPNRIYGSRQSEGWCVEVLQEKLAQDHKIMRSHQNSYEFPE